MADGHLNRCKDCTRTHTKEWYAERRKDKDFLESERDRARRGYHRLKATMKKPSLEKMIDYSAAYRQKYPEKYRARFAMQAFPKLPTGFHYHHWAYCKPYLKDVFILSIANHAKLHRFLEYNQPYCMYNDIEGNLLDTREKHEAYMNAVLENEKD